MPSDEQKPWEKVALPTDEQVERAARLICRTRGENEEPTDKLANDPKWSGWQFYREEAEIFVLLSLNKDMILGYGHD